MPAPLCASAKTLTAIGRGEGRDIRAPTTATAEGRGARKTSGSRYHEDDKSDAESPSFSFPPPYRLYRRPSFFLIFIPSELEFWLVAVEFIFVPRPRATIHIEDICGIWNRHAERGGVCTAPKRSACPLCKPVTRVRHWNSSESNEVAGDEARVTPKTIASGLTRRGITFGATIKSHSTLTNISIPYTPRPELTAALLIINFHLLTLP